MQLDVLCHYTLEAEEITFAIFPSESPCFFRGPVRGTEEQGGLTASYENAWWILLLTPNKSGLGCSHQKFGQPGTQRIYLGGPWVTSRRGIIFQLLKGAYWDYDRDKQL